MMFQYVMEEVRVPISKRSPDVMSPGDRLGADRDCGVEVGGWVIMCVCVWYIEDGEQEM